MIQRPNNLASISRTRSLSDTYWKNLRPYGPKEVGGASFDYNGSMFDTQRLVRHYDDIIESGEKMQLRLFV
jgi:hypothetical protein